jgi:2-oxo-4-hydroxy-4-carboxy-5-ureidoimidazoline decarboxylase
LRGAPRLDGGAGCRTSVCQSYRIAPHREGAGESWGSAELEQALSAHPRIGEKPAGSRRMPLSRQEQSAVNVDDMQLAEALRMGNARYEARFGRVFLIRAKGRSGKRSCSALEQRLANSVTEEMAVALEQLREITLLRLAGAIGE